MASVNNIKLTAGLEATAGTAVSRTKVVPISGVVTIDRKANTGPDPAVVGNNMTSGNYILFADVAGDIPLAVRSVGGFGMLVKSLLGTENTVKQIAGCVRMRYTGSDASAKIVANEDPTNTIVSSTGDKGSESTDSNFGSSGTYSLTGKTLADVVSDINGYTDYDCEKVFGDDSLDVASVVVGFTNKQGKDTWVYIWFSSASSGVYRHEFVVDLSSSERPTLTLQKDGYHDNFLYTGAVVDKMTLSGALKAICEGSASVLGFTETIGQSASGLSLEEYEPLIFYNGDFSLGGTDYDYIRNFEVNFDNQHNPDGYGAQSVDRQYHQKGMFDATGKMQVRLDSSSYAERAKVFNNTRLSVSILLTGGDVTSTVPELMLIELPYCDLTTFDFTENNGIFDASLEFQAVKPTSSPYNDPVTITLLNEDSAVY